MSDPAKPNQNNKEQSANPTASGSRLVVREERSVSVVRSGPIPPPEELAAYDKIIPNGADRILAMAERQSAHRIEIERSIVISQQSLASRGQIFGLVIAMFVVSLATYAAIAGQPLFGGALAGTTVVSLVSAFIYSKSAQNKELSEKRNKMVEAVRPRPVSELKAQSSVKSGKRK